VTLLRAWPFGDWHPGPRPRGRAPRPPGLAGDRCDAVFVGGLQRRQLPLDTFARVLGLLPYSLGGLDTPIGPPSCSVPVGFGLLYALLSGSGLHPCQVSVPYGQCTLKFGDSPVLLAGSADIRRRRQRGSGHRAAHGLRAGMATRTAPRAAAQLHQGTDSVIESLFRSSLIHQAHPMLHRTGPSLARLRATLGVAGSLLARHRDQCACLSRLPILPGPCWPRLPSSRWPSTPATP
jgi:hypothetical protein